MKATVDIARDLAKIPTLVSIQRGAKTLNITFDAERGFEFDGPRDLIPSFAELAALVYPVTSVLTVRGLNWFDRNPTITVWDWQNLNVAPHAYTTRATSEYTVPTDRIAMLELMRLLITRSGAAAPVGRANACLRITPPGGVATTTLKAVLLNNTEGAQASEQLGATLTLPQGTLLNVGDYDGSTGGTVDYDLGYKLMEFDT